MVISRFFCKITRYLSEPFDRTDNIGDILSGEKDYELIRDRSDFLLNEGYLNNNFKW